MGLTKTIQGDGHIVFHVGSSLPQRGESMYLLPGGQTAQGWGVYCSEKPIITYSGGEHRQRKLEYTPVFCIPEQGLWRKGTSKKGDTVLNTEGRIILMKDLQYEDATSPDGMKLRYYAPKECSFFYVPPPIGVDKMKRFNFSTLVQRKTDPTFDEIHDLVNRFQLKEEPVERGLLSQKLTESSQLEITPRFDFINHESDEEILREKSDYKERSRL